MVIMLIARPFNRLSGATHIMTRELTEVIAGLILDPISIIASMGIPYKAANAGSR